MKTPVAFLIFNRPDTTERVFQSIRQARPSKLLVVADGPRIERVGEVEKCSAARAIIDGVDWDCEVLTNYSDTNLGCKKRVSSGLDWVFNTVEEAIILEDDCLPDHTFFEFCEELLEKYRDNHRIIQISGINLQGKWKSEIQSYHFSYYGGIWGWASWRRAWKYYDVSMKLWSKTEVKNKIKDTLGDAKQYQLRKKRFDQAYYGQVDSWDPQWLFTRLLQSSLSVVPAVNLISNIGFGEEATRTKFQSKELANLPLHSLQFPLLDPSNLTADREYDHQFYLKAFKQQSMLQRAIGKVKRTVKQLTKIN